MTYIESYSYTPPDIEIVYYYPNDKESRILKASTTGFDQFCRDNFQCQLTLEQQNTQNQDISQTVVNLGPETWFGALGNTLQHQVLNQFINYHNNQTHTPIPQF